MGARFYAPYIARWLSADTLVPEPGNPQALNRYSYVVGRALNLTDPTGHYYYDPGCDCLVQTHENRLEHPDYTSIPTAQQYTIPAGAIEVQLLLEDLVEEKTIEQALSDIGETYFGSQAVEHVRSAGWTLRFGRPLGGGAFTYPGKVITVRRGHTYEQTRGMLAHEVAGHAWLYRGTLADSVEQELYSTTVEAAISLEMGSIEPGHRNIWLLPHVDTSKPCHRSDRWQAIKQDSLWSQIALPMNQPQGLGAVLWAVWQAWTLQFVNIR
jgi:hypothetical protein